MDNLGAEETRGEFHAARHAYGGFGPQPPAAGLRGKGRTRKLRRAVKEGLRRRAVLAAEAYEPDWPAVVGVEPVEVVAVGGAGAAGDEEMMFPQRDDSKGMDPHGGPPMMPRIDIRPRYIRTLRRLVVYLMAAARWYARILQDKLRGQDDIKRRATHLREIVERLGGTAIKIGQQASLRMDLLPREYGAELEKMLDRVPPFPTELAVARIVALTGKPLREIFSEFDPEPYGSGSVACIYKATLTTGEKVAVKVRRPGIRELFVSDCKALEWVLRTLEFFTFLRDGYSKNLIAGLLSILIEETEFVKEARYTEIFRRQARKRLRRVSAPKIFFDYSGDDVIVQEFIHGVRMGDIIAFVEQNDEEALGRLRQLNIDPKRVAKKLIRVNQWGVFENTLFHADPHPSNLIVRPNNCLVFIDFGAVGAYTTMERNNWRQLNYYHQRRDVGRMAQTALAILEPLPAIDVDEFRGRLEQIFWEDIYAHQSKHTEWYEHTSVRIWMHLFELSFEFNVPMGINTLRMIRSTLLSETVAARLHPNISAWREHRKYNRAAARRSRRRVLRSISRRLCGPTDTDYQRIEQFMGLFNRTVYLYQRWIDNPLYRYGLLVKKAVYAVIVVVKSILTFLMVATAGLIAYILYEIFKSGAYRSAEQFGQYMRSPFIMENLRQLFLPTGDEFGRAPSAWTYLPLRLILLGVLISVFLNMRRVIRRFKDREIPRRNASGLS
ncbi:MAG TPA: AarF/UbiB family protein [Pyrinomonadaceae bacterium]|jgi:ubiquinone biosynthesis protein